jgi:hypothetical protein
MTDIEKGKRKRTRRRLTALERLHEDCNHPTEPGHASADANALADGYTAGMHQATADETKSARDMAASATSARGGSPGNVAGYNAQRAGSSSRRVAAGHPDLQQASVFQGALSRLRTNTTVFLGQSGFHGDFSGSDSPQGAPGNHVEVFEYDPAGAAGSYAGMMPVDTSARRDEGYAQHRSSPTAPNGSHALRDVESNAVRNKSRVQIMKEALFGE